MQKKLYTLLIIMMSSVLQAQDSTLIKYAETIKKEDLKKHLSILASDEYEGRETGKRGQKMAAKYIQTELRKLGIEGGVKNAENPYLQTFDLEQKSWADVYIKTKKGTLKHFKDFFIYGSMSYHKETVVETIFVGYGLDHEKYSDYKNLDVKGKIVVFMEGEPQKKDSTYLISGTTEIAKSSSVRSKYRIAMQKGAKGIVSVAESNATFRNTLGIYRGYLERPSLGFPEKEKVRFGMISTSPKGAGKLLGISSKKFLRTIRKMNKKGKTRAGKFSSKIRLKAHRKTERMSTENILGFMEGTDKKDEILVITAHYDHIGIVNNKINNGADDDGSGTVSVLEIAKAFSKAKAAGKGPRRSILFMWFTGEEKGLLGSEYYADHPVYPMQKTITDLNIDMVGRVDDAHKGNPNYIYLIGSNMLSSELHEISEETARTYAKNVKLDYEYNDKNDPNRYYYRSDHYNFAKFNVPVIFYFNGTHEDYHQPGDDVEKIHFNKMEKVVRLIFSTAWQLAHREKAPVVDQIQGDE